MLSSLMRRALTAALIGAAGAAGTMLARRMIEKRSRRLGRGTYNERLALSRWENEGGQPAQPRSGNHTGHGTAPL